jgi:solute carrier family 24 (sodium/potassium/calcium exchanger), member 6
MTSLIHRQQWVASYAGFFLSIAWIYATAAEVLNVVLMFGNLFHIPYQILGLTAISWFFFHWE